MQGQADIYPTFVEVDIFLAGNSDAMYNHRVHVARTSGTDRYILCKIEP